LFFDTQRKKQARLKNLKMTIPYALRAENLKQPKNIPSQIGEKLGQNKRPKAISL